MSSLHPFSGLVASRLLYVPDFPRSGVVFKDITPLLGDGEAFGAVIRALATRHTQAPGRVDVVAGVEARGFIIGAALAHELGVGFVPVRKVGKLPGATVQRSYDLEYGTATIEIHADAVTPGQRVLLVDDVLATGGTAIAAWDLLTACGAEVLELATARAAEAVERERRRTTPRAVGRRPPDEEHEWLLAPAAAEVLRCTEIALKGRAARGQVPCTVHGGRRWFRLDLLELLLRAQMAQAQGTVSTRPVGP